LEPISSATPFLAPLPPAKRQRTTAAAQLDRLGKNISRDTDLLNDYSLFDLLRSRRGQSNLTTLAGVDHPARPLLQHLSRSGFPVVLSTPPWTLEQRDHAVARGPHQSAHQFLDFLRDELADMVDRATWMVLPYHRLRELHNLRLSPMGVVPQHARRPRPIVDYTFSGINHDTLPLSPREAMQFGRALDRIISQVVHADPRFGPVRFIKLDIADGFYRVWLRVEDVPKLAVTIPSLPGEAPLVALPLALPMGWTQSPPAFCAVTETVADLANARLRRILRSSPHRLDSLAATLPSPPTSPFLDAPPSATALNPQPPPIRHLTRRVRSVDVFVDDFIALAQGGARQRTHVQRTLMSAIDDVFRPLAPHDPPDRTEPISVKKLRAGDASWDTCKTLLGWIIDSVAMTITLPPRRLARLSELLASILPTRRRLALPAFHKLLGELRSMSLALPGARGLFSHLQAALYQAHTGRLRLSPGFHRALDDFRWLHDNLSARPTRLFELVPTAPVVVGTHDASALGAGGVWFPTPLAAPRTPKLADFKVDGSLHWSRHRLAPAHPIVWRVPFPPDVSAQVRTFAQPHGRLNNSELELLGHLWHLDVGAHTFDIRERTVHSATDNLATLFWARQGSTTTTSPAATLLRHLSMHQRYHRYVSSTDYIPGDLNVMADAASRLCSLSDADFLTEFNALFPQRLPWHLFRPSPALISTGISALRMQTCTSESFLLPPTPPRRTGSSGLTTVPPYRSTLLYKTLPTPSLSSKSLPTASGTASSTLAAAPSAAAPLRVPYAALAKRSRVWGPRTHVSPHRANSIIVSNDNLPVTPVQTRLRSA